jgi:Zn finger protein HypA/HybF involved in hydrogenase expression
LLHVRGITQEFGREITMKAGKNVKFASEVIQIGDNFLLEDGVFKDANGKVVKKPSEVPCPKCGQIDDGQQGAYPCPNCGLPMLHNDYE